MSNSKGRIYVIGIGPGDPDYIIPAAEKAIQESDIIIGYKTYLDLVSSLISGKEVLSSGMRQEVDRCTKAVELAGEGKKVAIICSGDPGIYAMAGLVFEIMKGRQDSIDIEIVPGIPALSACAARLGAPLMHDFASVSLSDLLTPWDLIEKRIEAAASADFVMVLYNPKSKGRQEHINKARDIIIRYRSPDTPVGIVKAATRENEKIMFTDLKHMTDCDIDMQSTVIIGNSQTFAWDGRMVTPRGYGSKYRISD